MDRSRSHLQREDGGLTGNRRKDTEGKQMERRRITGPLIDYETSFLRLFLSCRRWLPSVLPSLPPAPLITSVALPLPLSLSPPLWTSPPCPSYHSSLLPLWRRWVQLPCQTFLSLSLLSVRPTLISTSPKSLEVLPILISPLLLFLYDYNSVPVTGLFPFRFHKVSLLVLIGSSHTSSLLVIETTPGIVVQVVSKV